MTVKFSVKSLTGVSETLLIPLIGRSNYAWHTQFKDELAKNIVAKLDDDNFKFKRFKKDRLTQKACVLRGHAIDERVVELIKQNKNVVLINLGAGFCTRYYRLKERGTFRCFDVDFPAVIKLKKELLLNETDGGNYQLIESSILEQSWISEIVNKVDANSHFIFTLEGVSMYLKTSEMIKLIKLLTQNFKQFDLLFDFIHPLVISSYLYLPSIRVTKTTFHFGTSNLKKFVNKLNIRGLKFVSSTSLWHNNGRYHYLFKLANIFSYFNNMYSIGEIHYQS